MRVPALRLDANGNIIAKDGNGNDIQITDAGSLNTGNGTLGGYFGELAYAPSGSIVETSATFVDIAGMVNQSFTTPVSGIHEITIHAQHYADPAYVGIANADAEIQLLINDSTSVDDNFLTQALITNGATSWQGFSHTFLVDLAAGTHTIRPQWRTGGAAANPGMGAGREWHINISAQGSAINGLEVQEAELAADYLVPNQWSDIAGGNLVAVTGLSIDVSVLESERVQLNFNSIHNLTDTNDQGICVGYIIDGGTPIVMGYSVERDATGGGHSNFNEYIELTAGKHTIQAAVARTSASNNLKLLAFGGATFANIARTKMQVIRHKSIGIGAGTIVTQDTLSVSKNITTQTPSWEDTGLEVTINTIEGEDVEIAFAGGYLWSLGAGSNQVTTSGYQIDSDTPIAMTTIAHIHTYHMKNGSFTTVAKGLSAGAHTIKIVANTNSATNTFQLRAAAVDSTPTLTVTQYRGGLIPVKDDGVEIVEKPSALNFVGALVEANGTEAKVTFPNAALGGYFETLSFTGVASSASTSFIDITSMVNQTFTTPVSGPHLIQMAVATYASTAYTVLEIGAVIDDGTVQSMGKSSVGNTGVFHMQTVTLLVDLAAGEHTIRPQWKRTGGTGTMLTHTDVPWTATIQAQGGGINGLEVLEDTIASNFTVTSYPTTVFEDTGFEITFDALEGEYVELKFDGSIRHVAPASTTVSVRLAYKLDAAADVLTVIDALRDTGDKDDHVTMSRFIGPLTTGSHTVKIRAATGGSGTQQWLIFSASNMQIVRYKTLDTNWKSFTPTGSWTTNTTYTGFYRQIGDTLECRVQVECTGAPTATNLTIDLPAGYTIDTTKINGTTQYESNFGSVSALNTGVAQYVPSAVDYDTTTSVACLYPGTDGTTGLLSATAPFTFGSGDKVFARFSVPVT